MGIEKELTRTIHKEVDEMARMGEERDTPFSDAIYSDMVEKYILQNGIDE